MKSSRRPSRRSTRRRKNHGLAVRHGRRTPRIERFEDRRLLAVFDVNSELDTQDADPGDGIAEDASGRTTLRAAVMESNAWDDGGPDTINLLAGNYLLQLSGTGEDDGFTGDLDVTDDLTIVGADADSTIIDASGLSSRDRVLHVHRGTADDRVTFELSGLTITGGLAEGTESFADRAGGMFVDFYTDVTVSQSVFRGNSAPRTAGTSVYGSGGAITNSGNLEILASTFEDNHASNSGGAIYVGGSGATTTIRESTFSDNSARDGGAIEGRYVTTIENSTFVMNKGLHHSVASGSGGAIRHIGGELTVTNSTITGNESIFGGGVSASGDVRVYSSTIAHNSARSGGGLGANLATVENSILSDNSASVDGPNVVGEIASLGHNLVGDTTDSVGWIASDLLDVEPLLGPLADNGGPTRTHSVPPESPAVDAANTATAPGTDQRGVVRPQGDEADIGAFEVIGSVNTPPAAVDDAYTVNEDETLVVGASNDAVLRYRFDEASSGEVPASDSGAAPAAPGEFLGSATRIDATPGDFSSGALDLTAGVDSNNYVSDNDAGKIDELTEMTVTLWLNLRDDPQDEDVLLSDLALYPPFPSTSTSGWELRITGPLLGEAPTADNFRLAFETARIGTGLANSQTGVKGPVNAERRWTFLAVTLTSDGRLSWYQGSETAQESGFGHTNFAPQYLPTDLDNPADLRIGGSTHEPSIDHTPPAWIDDVQIHDRVLDASELEAIRLDNLSPFAVAGVLSNDTDDDGDALGAVLVSGPAHGRLTLNPDGSFEYTPESNFSGTDRFRYKAGDGAELSNIATVTITVNPMPDPPSADDDEATTDENVSAVIAVLANDTDIDGDPLAVIDVSDPAHGMATINPGGTVTYTPDTDFEGADAFQYTISDGSGGSDTAVVSVIVRPGNDAPVANDDAYQTPPDTQLVIENLLGAPMMDQQSPVHDHVISTSFFRLQQQVRAGMTGRLDSVDVYIGSNTKVGSTLTVEIHRGAPWQTDLEDFSARVEISSGMPGDWLSIDTSPGEIDLVAGELFVVETSGSGVGLGENLYVGASREENVGDAYPPGQLWADGVPFMPTGSSEYDLRFRTRMLPLVSDEGVLRNDSDPEGDPLIAVLVTSTSNGDLMFSSTGGFTYTPNPGFVGVDTFTYRVFDGTSNSNEATVSITVAPPNRSPVAADDAATTDKDSGEVVIDVLANDTDPDGDSLAIVRVTQPANGRAIIDNDQNVVYIPDDGFHGIDRFIYTISDGNGGVDSALVAVTVHPDQPPTVQEVVVNGDRSDPPDRPDRGVQPTGWRQQRSDIRSIVIRFSQDVLIDTADIRLTNLGLDAPNDPDQVVSIAPTQIEQEGGTVVIGFLPESANDLEDGVYRLELSDTVTNLAGLRLDGDGDGNEGGAFTLVGDPTNGLFQLKGDWNGDQGVSIFDFQTFVYWFGSQVPAAPEYVDLDFDDGVSIFDFSPFASGFGDAVRFSPPLAPLFWAESILSPTTGSPGRLDSSEAKGTSRRSPAVDDTILRRRDDGESPWPGSRQLGHARNELPREDLSLGNGNGGSSESWLVDLVFEQFGRE